MGGDLEIQDIFIVIIIKTTLWAHNHFNPYIIQINPYFFLLGSQFFFVVLLIFNYFFVLKKNKKIIKYSDLYNI